MDDILVAYQREDGNYTVHETNGDPDVAALAAQLTYRTPFGGPDGHNLWARMAIEALRWDDSAHLTHLLEQSERPPTAVRVEPIHCGVGFDELRAERLNYRTTAFLLVVSTTYDVTTYRAVWLAFEDEVHTGALVPTDSLDGETVRERCFEAGYLAVRGAISTAQPDRTDPRAILALQRAIRTLVDDSSAVLLSGIDAEEVP